MPPKDVDKPWHASKMVVTLLFHLAAVLLMFGVVAFRDVVHESLGRALEILAAGTAAGLSVVLGMKGWADRTAVGAAVAAAPKED